MAINTIILVVLILILLIVAAMAVLMVMAAKQWAEFRSLVENYISTEEAHGKRQQSVMAEFLIEQRRMTRVMSESLELKKAEMTGDFEIVEEPIPVTAPPPGAPSINFAK